MITKYNVHIDNESIIKELNKITNQIFKLLPNREEGGNWESPLQNLIVELIGMNRLFNKTDCFFPLICRMEGLLTLTKEEDFIVYRKNIFECLGLVEDIKDVFRKYEKENDI